MNIFQKYLRQRMESRGWNQLQLAERIGVPQSTVCRWLAGVSPKIDTMERVISLLGDGLSITTEGAAPADSAETEPPCKVWGRLSGDNPAVELLKARESISVPPDWQRILRDSQFWRVTTGPIFFLHHEESSLYSSRHGVSYLACRLPVSANTDDLPRVSPVVVQDGDSPDKLTLAILQRGDGTEDRAVHLLLDIFRAHRPARILRPESVKIRAIVLGKISVT